MNMKNTSEPNNDHSNYFSLESTLSLDEQKFIDKSSFLFYPKQHKQLELSANDSVNAYESVNGGCKYGVKNELNWPNYEVVLQLKNLKSNDSPKEVARLLQYLFSPWPSNDGHWLWIAQRYTPRVINWQVSATIKEYLRGAIRKTPPAYFTFEIHFRRKIKSKHQKEKEGTQ